MYFYYMLFDLFSFGVKSLHPNEFICYQLHEEEEKKKTTLLAMLNEINFMPVVMYYLVFLFLKYFLFNEIVNLFNKHDL